MKKDFVRLKDYSTDEIMELLSVAEECKKGGNIDRLKGLIVCNLFFEPSTRTQYSFNVAEEKLGMKVVCFSPAASSIIKGETFYDTVRTFESLGTNVLVIRSKIDEYYKQLEGIKVPIINAGDGVKDHPSQSMLDLYTIYEQFGYFEGLKIAIVGDVSHSRVAHTNIEIMNRLGMKTYISGPEFYQDGSAEFIEFDKAVEEMDIIMMLRIQHERHEEAMSMCKEEYHEKYGLTMDRVNKMKDNAIIMHPAPVNRNVEIADDVVECEKSRIFTQMENGVYVRMAMLLRVLGGKHDNTDQKC